MATETVTLTVGEDWVLVSEVGADSLQIADVSPGLVLSIGVSAPTDQTRGFSPSVGRVGPVGSARVWARSLSGLSFVTMTRTVSPGQLTLAPLMFENQTLYVGADPASVIATISGRTPGSRLSLLPDPSDGRGVPARQVLSSDQTQVLVGQGPTRGHRRIVVQEELAGAANSPRQSILQFSFVAPTSEIDPPRGQLFLTGTDGAYLRGAKDGALLLSRAL